MRKLWSFIISGFSRLENFQYLCLFICDWMPNHADKISLFQFPTRKSGKPELRLSPLSLHHVNYHSYKICSFSYVLIFFYLNGLIFMDWSTAQSNPIMHQHVSQLLCSLCRQQARDRKIWAINWKNARKNQYHAECCVANMFCFVNFESRVTSMWIFFEKTWQNFVQKKRRLRWSISIAI